MARGSQRVFLHIGLPKTGTTFLQSVLGAGRGELRKRGVLFPWPTSSHFWAAQDLTDHLFLGVENPRVPGSWAKIARKARRWSGTTVISHELLTLATPTQVAQAVTDLSPAEVHVVLTVRDFERQVPAVWQERLKNGGRVTFERHFEQAMEHEAARGAEPEGFWRQQDAVGILSRWAQVVPRDRIHVITIPQPGAPRDTLWRRFAQVVGFDADLVDLASVDATGNVSLRPPQARVLRRVNHRLQDSLPPAVYRSVVKGYLTETAAAGASTGAAYGLDAEQLATTRRWSDELRAALSTGGYDVVGHPDELLAAAPPEPRRGLDDVSGAEEAAATVAATASLVRWLAEPPAPTRPTSLRSLAGQLRSRS